MTAAAVLSEALATIAAHSRWTKHAVAKDRKHNECKPTAPQANSFCMVGAIQKVDCPADAYGEAIRTLRNQCGKQSIFEFNDNHEHKAVVSCMRRAIRAAEAVHG